MFKFFLIMQHQKVVFDKFPNQLWKQNILSSFFYLIMQIFHMLWRFFYYHAQFRFIMRFILLELTPVWIGNKATMKSKSEWLGHRLNNEDENFSWWKLKPVMQIVLKIYHWDTNSSLWWFLLLEWKFMSVMKLYLRDENLYMWWKFITETKFI